MDRILVKTCPAMNFSMAVCPQCRSDHNSIPKSENYPKVILSTTNIFVALNALASPVIQPRIIINAKTDSTGGPIRSTNKALGMSILKWCKAFVF
jgi:hypothetical protein